MSGILSFTIFINLTPTSKYSATMGAYQRNTGSPHSLSSRFDFHSAAKRNGNVSLVNYNADLWYGEIDVGTPPKKFTGSFDLLCNVIRITPTF